MGKRVESHPDAQSRKEMLEQMHRRAGQKLQQPSVQSKLSGQDEKESPETTPKNGVTR